MNTYDFDKTIFYPDSSFLFVRYCLKHFPRAVIKVFPGAVKKYAGYFIKKENAAPIKEQMFSFLPRIKDIDAVVEAFWAENYSRIEPWYLEQKKDDDLIISASPEFLLKPAIEKLGVRLIGTKMDKHTGKISGSNCHDEEKVIRFRSEYPGEVTENFYSDSLTDTPMAEIADNAFLVDHGKISRWPNK